MTTSITIKPGSFFDSFVPKDACNVRVCLIKGHLGARSAFFLERHFIAVAYLTLAVVNSLFNIIGYAFRKCLTAPFSKEWTQDIKGSFKSLFFLFSVPLIPFSLLFPRTAYKPISFAEPIKHSLRGTLQPLKLLDAAHEEVKRLEKHCLHHKEAIRLLNRKLDVLHTLVTSEDIDLVLQLTEELENLQKEQSKEVFSGVMSTFGIKLVHPENEPPLLELRFTDQPECRKIFTTDKAGCDELISLIIEHLETKENSENCFSLDFSVNETICVNDEVDDLKNRVKINTTAKKGHSKICEDRDQLAKLLRRSLKYNSQRAQRGAERLAQLFKTPDPSPPDASPVISKRSGSVNS